MFKYALKLLMGADPDKIMASMPKDKLAEIDEFVRSLDETPVPRKQRRIIQRKWKQVYERMSR